MCPAKQVLVDTFYYAKHPRFVAVTPAYRSTFLWHSCHYVELTSFRGYMYIAKGYQLALKTFLVSFFITFSQLVSNVFEQATEKTD